MTLPIQITELEVAHSEIEMLKADREMIAKIILARNNEVSDLRHRMVAIQQAMNRGEYRLAKELSDHTKIRTVDQRLREDFCE